MSCVVEYQETVALGIKAMKVPRDRLHMPSFSVKVQAPDVWHSVTDAALNAWLVQNGRSPKEQALKSRVAELIKG